MKKALVLALFAGIVSIGIAPSVADAKRIGAGGSAGMQRSMPARPAPDALPAKPGTNAAAPATAGAAPAAAAAAPKRSWMGPIAGLAAGLGIAALMSHLGLGAEFANILMMVLLAVVAFVAIRFLLRRFGTNAATNRAPQGLQFAGAGAGATPPATGGSGWGAPATAATTAAPPVVAAADAQVPAAGRLPEGFDAAGFERIAKMIFIRMQAANDTGDLNDLRAFTTPEMFAAVKLDLQERGSVAQTTDVVRIDAEVLDVATETDRQIVSVRFHGLLREEKDGVAAPFDELWHLVKPADGSREWAIAGIQQTQAA
jgi:predicted lipid-binding transport protein (Tim44 family)